MLMTLTIDATFVTNLTKLLPAHLHDEDITHNSFRRELKTFLF